MIEELKNKKFLWAIAALTVFNVSIYIFSPLIVDIVADRVIEKLEREYSPSPYGPGFDPDKVNLDNLKKGRQKNNEEEEAYFPVNYKKENWASEWEKSRFIKRGN